MHKIHIIGIGFRPLDTGAHDVLLASDVVLANERLLDVFKDYREYEHVREKIIVHPGVHETIDYIADNCQEKRLSLLAAGDPMFFGIGRLIIQRFGQDAVEVFPDLSSVQVAFARIKETSNNAFFISLHGGPDPENRRKLEYEITEVPELLKRHRKIAILTDKVNSPPEIAKGLLYHPDVNMYVCEKLGYPDERITMGTPEEISKLSFENPNVVILVCFSQQLHGAP